ncbi:MAG: hypothetical protein V4722_21870 [Bacteroidota bacterium]
MKKIAILIVSISSVQVSGAQTNIGIGTATPNNKLEVIHTVTGPSYATIFGNNTGTSGNAVYGVSHAGNTSGVRGTSTSGVGIYGYSNTYIAVGAGAIGGTAVYAQSASGLGLSVYGKIQLTGGDTNPVDGAILISDATGNAVWKPKQIGFAASSAANTSIPISTFRKVEYGIEDFDLQNNFVPYPGATSSATSVFTAPVAGIYHFAASAFFQSSQDIDAAQIRLIKNTSSTVLANFEGDGAAHSPSVYYVSLDIEGDYYLAANDKVWVEVAQRNLFNSPLGLSSFSYRGRFTGMLKIAD